jgi:hypothetical protein
LPSGRVGFSIDNKTELASGTHFPLRKKRDFPNSLEDLVAANPQLADEPLGKFLYPSYGVISVLRPKSRAETQDSGGGTIEQVFRWSERRLDCSEIAKPYPQYIPLIDVGPLAEMPK